MLLFQVLGGDVYRLHPAADGEADHVHDSHGVGHLARHFTGTHFRLEGRGLAPSGRGQTAVSHQPRRWLSGRLPVRICLVLELSTRGATRAIEEGTFG